MMSPANQDKLSCLAFFCCLATYLVSYTNLGLQVNIAILHIVQGNCLW